MGKKEALFCKKKKQKGKIILISMNLFSPTISDMSAEKACYLLRNLRCRSRSNDIIKVTKETLVSMKPKTHTNNYQTFSVHLWSWILKKNPIRSKCCSVIWEALALRYSKDCGASQIQRNDSLGTFKDMYLQL